MIIGAVLLPFIGKYQPTAIYETGNACFNKISSKVFRAKHVVPTIYSWPNVSLGLPLRERDRIGHIKSPYVNSNKCAVTHAADRVIVWSNLA